MTESVWDYPRPPAIERCPRRVRVILGGETIADSVAAWRVLETSHPPGIYVPLADIRPGALTAVAGTSVCEWKGTATYCDVHRGGITRSRAAWRYPDPSPGYEALIGHVSFYPGLMDACLLDEDPVVPQEGGFYGGWITSDIAGPFKGAPGTMGW